MSMFKLKGGSTYRFEPLSLLIIEDNAGDARLVELGVKRAEGPGVRVEVASSVADARDRLREFDCSAILLDVNLPDARGSEGILELQRWFPELPIVVHSGSGADEQTVLDLIDAGAQDFLVKSRVSPEEICRALRIAIRRKEAERRLQSEAREDRLTGLGNRAMAEAALDSAIGRARRNVKPLALLFMDLDRFKLINDTHGHDVGDEVLVEVARRLAECVRESDTVARLGGDEFIVVLENLDGSFDPGRVARKIANSIAIPIETSAGVIETSTSVGVATYPEVSGTPQDLLKAADNAMYAAKRAGRNQVSFQTNDQENGERRATDIADSLQLALERDEFELFYQPQLSADGKVVTAIEALVRWRRFGESTLVMPDDFVYQAERSNFIVRLGEWVLERACEQHRRWRQTGLYPGRMSVNLSVRQLESADFIERLDAILRSSGMPGSALMLELTETALMSNPSATAEVLDALKRRGIHIALDDFGTGYCSLSYIRSLAVDSIKIDRSFIANLDDDVNLAIVQSVLAMAKALHADVIAEGVETVTQLQTLKSAGVNAMQGNLFCRAVPPLELQSWMRAGAYVANLPKNLSARDTR